MIPQGWNIHQWYPRKRPKQSCKIHDIWPSVEVDWAGVISQKFAHKGYFWCWIQKWSQIFVSGSFWIPILEFLQFWIPILKNSIFGFQKLSENSRYYHQWIPRIKIRLSWNFGVKTLCIDLEPYETLFSISFSLWCNFNLLLKILKNFWKNTKNIMCVLYNPNLVYSENGSFWSMLFAKILKDLSNPGKLRGTFSVRLLVLLINLWEIFLHIIFEW